MDANKVDMWLLSNSKYFEADKMSYIRERLIALPEDRIAMLYSAKLQDPTTVLIVSLFLGQFGVDRFMLGDIGLGIGKLLTYGGCLVWWFIDLFFIMGRTREVNFQRLMTALNYY
ncbi:MAG: TM2 domain-containing protein [Coriobacteriia bacterium]|nr:TM2 domain-containing protein [Coriobacteriia bacterium]